MDKEMLLIIPAYNEEGSIENTLRSVLAAEIARDIDILVIDDGSQDNTACLARQCGITVLSQCFHIGYGAALQTGYKYAVLHGYMYVLQMDADGQHDVSNLKIIADRLKGDTAPDIVIGSRFLDDRNARLVTGLKRLAIKAFCGVIRRICGESLTDPTSGLQGLSKKAVSYYALFENLDLKYPDLNMVVQMLLQGYRVEEVPALMHERRAGVSMHSGLWNAGKYMVLMGISTCSVIIRYSFVGRKA